MQSFTFDGRAYDDLPGWVKQWMENNEVTAIKAGYRLERTETLPGYLPGDLIFDMQSERGIPIEEIEDYAHAKGWKMDWDGYQKRMDEHKRLSREASKF